MIMLKISIFIILQKDYVHNFDSLLKERKYNILCEGDLDALAVDGIGIFFHQNLPERLKRILIYL